MALGAFHVFRENVFHGTRDFAGPVSLKGNLGYGVHSLHKFETACLSEAFFFRGKRLGKVRKVAMTARNQSFWLRALLTWVAFSRGVTRVTNTTSHLKSCAACFRRALVAAHVTMRATTMILFVALVALAFPQGTHAGCLTDQAVEGFFEGEVRLVAAIPRSRFRLSGTVAVSLRRERARGDPLEASAPAQSSCATARAISPPTRARDDSGRRARVSRHVFPTEDPPRFRFGTEPSVGRAENLPPGATSLPPSLEAHGVS